MRNRFGGQRVFAPDGMEWHVGRRWLAGDRRHSRAWPPETAADVANEEAPFDFIGVDLEGALAAMIFAALLALVVLPILLFGVELIIAGWVISAALVWRFLLLRPWLIEAKANRVISEQGGGLAWRVTGWRASRQLIDQVVKQLTLGLDPYARPGAERRLTV